MISKLLFAVLAVQTPAPTALTWKPTLLDTAQWERTFEYFDSEGKRVYARHISGTAKTTQKDSKGRFTTLIDWVLQKEFLEEEELAVAGSLKWQVKETRAPSGFLEFRESPAEDLGLDAFYSACLTPIFPAKPVSLSDKWEREYQTFDLANLPKTKVVATLVRLEPKEKPVSAIVTGTIAELVEEALALKGTFEWTVDLKDGHLVKATATVPKGYIPGDEEAESVRVELKHTCKEWKPAKKPKL